MLETNNIVNIASYKFIELTQLEQLQKQLLEKSDALSVKGTIVLSKEGINLMLAGGQTAIDQFIGFLTSDERFTDMPFKKSFSDTVPFRRMRVRLKKEIVTMKKPDADPNQLSSCYISPETLKQWLDEKKDITLLDTRNHYEVALGSFEGTEHLSINYFSEFPEAVKQADFDKEKTVVMFCTGGIRCEKASLEMQHQGYKNVYQLDGGILNYFQQCGSTHYQGDCFVFDQRTALDSDLNETGIKQCPHCDRFIQVEEQNHPGFIAWKRCQYCFA